MISEIGIIITIIGLSCMIIACTRQCDGEDYWVVVGMKIVLIGIGIVMASNYLGW
jgi:uncharacterized Tic20 family protein